MSPDEIKEMIVAIEGEDQLFYVFLLNPIMKIRRIETLPLFQEFQNYDKKDAIINSVFFICSC